MNVRPVTIAIAAAAAAALLLTGCNDSFQDGFDDGFNSQGHPTLTEGDSPAQVGDLVLHDPETYDYLGDEELRREAYTLALLETDIPSAQVAELYNVGMPELICDSLDAGAGFYEVTESGVLYGDMTWDDSSYYTGVAIGGWCPQHAGAIR